MRALLLLAVLASVAQAQPGGPAAPASVPDSTEGIAEADTLAAVVGALPRGPHAPMPASLAGVVWDAPETDAEAIADLAQMRRAGVRAVRTGLVTEAVLGAADRLGIAVVQELPIADVPASRLAALLPMADSLLSLALDRASRHASARVFILARGVDTSDRAARPYFERLTARVQEQGPEGARTAYLTRFVDDDRASETVDLVLLDARGRDPFDLLARWRARHETPAGLGAWGVGVVPGREGGWRRTGTEAHQGRTVETTLDRFLTMADPPEAAFLARWQDRTARDVRSEVAGFRYGLVAEDGASRPALAVASGIFTGRQRVFAFDAGPPERGPRSGLLVLLGWTLMVGLGALLTFSPRLSGLVPHYFGRRDLYRESVQKSFGLSGGVTVGLAALLALTVGIVGATALRAVAASDALAVATASWEPGAQQRLVRLVGSPAVLGLLLAALYGAWLLLTTMWVSVLAGRRRRLRLAQALSLVVWPRWTWLVLLIGAMLIASLAPASAGVWAAVLVGAALVLETVAAWRMLTDLMAVGYVPAGTALGLGFVVPFVVLLVGAIVLVATAGAEMGFLWHLAVRN